MPIKCPVAPIEFTFLADWYLRERGTGERTELVLRDAARRLLHEAGRIRALDLPAAEKGDRARDRVQRRRGRRGRRKAHSATTGARIAFDLLVTVPLHGGAAYVERSPGLGDALGFVATDPRTLQTAAKPNVFALGDATDVPTSKAGSVAHFEGELLERKSSATSRRGAHGVAFDGHTNCFVETGFHKALLIDFNYDVEPLTGRFPTAIGPLPLLRESRLNHLGKLMFEWIYWHALLPGRNLPGLGAAMPTAGKKHIPTHV